MDNKKIEINEVKYIVFIEDDKDDICAFRNAFNDDIEKYNKELKLSLFYCLLPEKGEIVCEKIDETDETKNYNVMKTEGDNFFLRLINSIKKATNHDNGEDFSDILFLFDLGLQGKDKQLTNSGLTLIYNFLNNNNSPFCNAKYLCVTQNFLQDGGEYTVALEELGIDHVHKPDKFRTSDKNGWNFRKDQQAPASRKFVETVEKKLFENRNLPEGNRDSFIKSIKELLDKRNRYYNMIAEILYKTKY